MTCINLSELKVLTVDDNPVISACLAQCLKSFGFSDIDQAANVAEAAGKMKEKLYNIVFLDWNMPGRTGYSLLQACREDSRYDSTAFVICTSESGERYIIEALKAGATSYIVKPIEAKVITEHATKILAWLELRVNEKR